MPTTSEMAAIKGKELVVVGVVRGALLREVDRMLEGNELQKIKPHHDATLHGHE